MKIVFLAVLISTLVLISHQEKYALPQSGRVLPPWVAFPKQPTIGDYYEYLYARSVIESLKSAYQAPHRGANIQVNENVPQWSDIQSRTKSSGSGDEQTHGNGDDNARFFFNYVTTAGSSSYFNPLLKTIYYISTATATTTIVNTCVPAASFTSTLYTVACRKRRELMNLLLGQETPEDNYPAQSDQVPAPSKVQPIEASAEAPLPRALGDDGIMIPIEIASSKAEDYLVEKGFFSEVDKLREKRFLIASTTITSFAFITTTSVKTLSNLGSELSCLPTQFSLC